MTVVDIFISVILLAICIYAFVSDLCIGKVRNIVLIISSLVLLVLNLIKFIFISHDDLFLYIQNASTVLILGFLGYIIRLWAGGDCKLIILIALFYPTAFYFDYNQSRYTLWLIIVIAFIFGFVYLLFDSTIKTIKDKSSFKLEKVLSMLKKALITYSISFVYLTALNQTYLKFIYPWLEINSIIYFTISFLFVLGVSKTKIFNKFPIIFGVALFDIVLIIISHNFAFLAYWENYLLIFIFMILRVIMSLHNYQLVKTNEVKEGMVISRIDTVMMQKSRIRGLPNISDETLKSKLTTEEAESVRRWEKSKYGKAEVLIIRKIPFATFISIGVFIYFLTGVLQFCGLI